MLWKHVLFLSYLFTSGDAVQNATEFTSVETVPTLITDEEVVTAGVTEYEDLSENEEWVELAVMDVGYYLRNHKFNQFDRRYWKESNKVINLYKRFPIPPLRMLHWEVHKFCEDGFIQCLKYLHDTVKKSVLQRSQDASVLLERHGWNFLKNQLIIDTVDADCRRLLQLDNKHPWPFRGPLERFQWATTASYYMCWYTMQEHPSLSLMNGGCGNLAHCLEGNSDQMPDPRADNSQPYSCATYSFCPDICCPLRNVSEIDQCTMSAENPCSVPDLQNWTCWIDRKQNNDLISIIYNRWNYSCQCDDTNSIWNARFGICIDQNDCDVNEKACNETVEECLDLKGSYLCVCKYGYIWDTYTNSCVFNTALQESLQRINIRKEHESIWWDDKGFSILRGVIRFLNKTIHF